MHRQHFDLPHCWHRDFRYSGSPGPGAERGRRRRREKWARTGIPNISRSCFKIALVTLLGGDILHNARGKNSKLRPAKIGTCLATFLSLGHPVKK